MLATLFSHRAPAAAAKRRRGPRPAAGLLLRYSDFEGDWYLLGKRCWSLGGTWSNIGGSLNPGEHPLAGALREFFEELSVPAAALVGARIAEVIECGDEAVPYTLFVIDTAVCFDDAVLSWENTDLQWVLAEDVPTMNLHSGFARAWTQLSITHPRSSA